MSKDHLYTLEIHIDSRYITKQSLIESIKSFLRDYLNKIEWEVDSYNLYHQLTVIGDIQSIDRCHTLIQQSIINKHKLGYYRVIDEVGDEIRKRAYPILADIEQRFRAFINKVLVEVLGFDWWERYKLKEIPETINQRYQDYKNDQVAPSFLECSDFNHLVSIITAKVSELSSNKGITREDFDRHFGNCNTIEEVKDLWNEKTKVISLWDIFSRYFEDEQAWKNLENELNINGLVIGTRNKVMHHRPILFYVIKELENVQQRLIAIFNSAHPQLTDEVRIEVQQKTEKILRSQELRQHFNRSLDPSINRHFEQVKDDIIHFDQFTMGTRNAVKSPFNEFITETKNGINNLLNESIIRTNMGFSKEIDEFILGTRNAVKSPFNEFITEARKVIQNPLNESILNSKIGFSKEINEFILGTRNAVKSPFNEFITETKKVIQSPLNESALSSNTGFSKEINENIFPPLLKKSFLSLPAEQLRKQMSEKLRPSSGIQDVIESFERENALRKKVETPLENLRKFFY